jgi:hypothetical protein
MRTAERQGVFAMLLITVEVDPSVVTVRFDGQLSGPNARHLARTWPPAAFDAQGRPVLLDLAGVTSVDALGKEFLASLFRDGTALAAGIRTGGVVDEIIRESVGYHPGIDEPESS